MVLDAGVQLGLTSEWYHSIQGILRHFFPWANSWLADFILLRLKYWEIGCICFALATTILERRDHAGCLKGSCPFYAMAAHLEMRGGERQRV